MTKLGLMLIPKRNCQGEDLIYFNLLYLHFPDQICQQYFPLYKDITYSFFFPSCNHVLPSCITAALKRNTLHYFALQSILHVVADLEITNNTKDGIQADINEQKPS